MPLSILFASRANSRSHRTQWGIPHALRLNDSENGDVCIRSCLFKTLHRRGMQHICLFEKGILSWLLLVLLNGVQFLNMWNYTFLLVFVHKCFISSTFQTCEASSLLSFPSFTHWKCEARRVSEVCTVEIWWCQQRNARCHHGVSPPPFHSALWNTSKGWCQHSDLLHWWRNFTGGLGTILTQLKRQT